MPKTPWVFLVHNELIFLCKALQLAASLDSLDMLLPAPPAVKIPRTLETCSPSRKKLEEDQLNTTITSVMSRNCKYSSPTEKKDLEIFVCQKLESKTI